MQRIGLFLTVRLGVLSLVLSGSKGPALALLDCRFTWAARRGMLSGLLLWVLPAAVAILWLGDSPLMQRVAVLEEDLSTLDRLVLIQDVLAQVAASPLSGSAFVELNSGYYPHNIPLETAMALGIPVALVLLGLMALGLRRAWRALGTQSSDLLGLLYLQSFLAAWLSSALFGATMLWITLGRLLAHRPEAVGGRFRRARHAPRSASEARPLAI